MNAGCKYAPDYNFILDQTDGFYGENLSRVQQSRYGS